MHSSSSLFFLPASTTAESYPSSVLTNSLVSFIKLIFKQLLYSQLVHIQMLNPILAEYLFLDICFPLIHHQDIQILDTHYVKIQFLVTALSDTVCA
jgi:hypothetical protein